MTADLIALEQQITGLLKSLGDTCDDVANSLRARQVKGVPKDECSCPVARLLRELPGVADVEVGNGKAIVYPAGTDGTVEILLPEPVTGFAWMFDQHGGPFLDLIDTGSETGAVA